MRKKKEKEEKKKEIKPARHLVVCICNSIYVVIQI